MGLDGVWVERVLNSIDLHGLGGVWVGRVERNHRKSIEFYAF